LRGRDRERGIFEDFITLSLYPSPVKGEGVKEQIKKMTTILPI
jgi:hypothetical protein